MNKDKSNEAIIESIGTVFPKEMNLSQSSVNPDNLVLVLREFGIMGVVTYVGGAIMLLLFPLQADFGRQGLYAVSGLLLLLLATFISYQRINAQRGRDKLLIEMTQNANNRLAEQLGKGLTSDQIEFITQKIRQNQRDLFTAIFNQSLEK